MFTIGGSSGSESDISRSHSGKQQASCKVNPRVPSIANGELANDLALETDSSEDYDEIADTDDSLDWDDSTDGSGGANVDEKPLFQRVESGTKRSCPESLITTMLNQDSQARAHKDAAIVSTSLSPGSMGGSVNINCRREMLTHELSTSLRQHLLWERNHRSQIVLKRRHSDVGASKQQAEIAQLSKDGTVDIGDDVSDQRLGEYHSKGW